MIITLNSDWRIRSDPLQWIVEHRHVRKPGGADEYEEWVVWGHFNTLAAAVNSAVGARVRFLEGAYPHTALEELLGFLSEIRRDVDVVLEDLRP